MPRERFAFRPKAVAEEMLGIVATLANGDARIALQILLRAGKKTKDKQTEVDND